MFFFSFLPLQKRSYGPALKCGAVLDFPCPNVTSGFRHSIIPSFRASSIQDISGNIKARKLKFGINMDRGRKYCPYQNRDQRPITRKVISLDSFFNS